MNACVRYSRNAFSTRRRVCSGESGNGDVVGSAMITKLNVMVEVCVSVAQWLERRSANPKAIGSIPIWANSFFFGVWFSLLRRCLRFSFSLSFLLFPALSPFYAQSSLHFQADWENDDHETKKKNRGQIKETFRPGASSVVEKSSVLLLCLIIIILSIWLPLTNISCLHQ